MLRGSLQDCLYLSKTQINGDLAFMVYHKSGSNKKADSPFYAFVTLEDRFNHEKRAFVILDFLDEYIPGFYFTEIIKKMKEHWVGTQSAEQLSTEFRDSYQALIKKNSLQIGHSMNARSTEFKI